MEWPDCGTQLKGGHLENELKDVKVWRICWIVEYGPQQEIVDINQKLLISAEARPLRQRWLGLGNQFEWLGLGKAGKTQEYSRKTN